MLPHSTSNRPIVLSIGCLHRWVGQWVARLSRRPFQQVPSCTLCSLSFCLSVVLSFCLSTFLSSLFLCFCLSVFPSFCLLSFCFCLSVVLPTLFFCFCLLSFSFCVFSFCVFSLSHGKSNTAPLCPFLFTLTLILSSSSLCVKLILVVMMRSKEFKTARSILVLILRFSLSEHIL